MKLRNYRITKYNPIYRTSEGYTKDEWTSCSDVGKIYDGKIFTQAEYNLVEMYYLNVVKAIFEETEQQNVRIEKLENYKGLQWVNRQKLNLQEVEQFCRDCLQEKCWGKVEGENFFIHFGYDYYMYIGTTMQQLRVKEIVEANHLFCEDCPSPHND